ncbi:MAG: hypothetical protein Q9174_003386 [Haloplaca sp. 1 TL-2023]
MRISVDGGCRRNGRSNAIAAAACIVHLRGNRYKTWTRRLGDYPPPTNQAAEITAIILALETALEIYDGLDSTPYLDLDITTDSKYAWGCMTEWRYKWANNGWINSAGRDVANQELIQEAVELDERVDEIGKVVYTWVPRGQNTLADEAANDELDDIERDEAY